MIRSIHIGVTDVDRAAYPHEDGFDYALASSLTSAKLMEEVARAAGVTEPKLLHNPTVAEVAAAVSAVGVELQRGDTLFFTSCGHGCVVPSKYGDKADVPKSVSGYSVRGKYNQTILLHDRMLVDDEFAAMFLDFKHGVRIVTMIDSCNSGSFCADVFNRENRREVANKVQRARIAGALVMKPPPKLAEDLYARHKELYDSVQAEHLELPVVGIHFGGCQDDEESYANADGSGSLFTLAVHKLMLEKDPPATSAALHERLREQLEPQGQTPTLVMFAEARERDLQAPPIGAKG